MPLSLEGTATMLAEPYSRQEAILLVEDNEDDLLLTLRAFRKNHAGLGDLAVARDGAEALDYLFARGAYEDRNGALMPKLILLDINLPGLNGLDVLRAVRSDPRTKALPVVMLTTSASDRDLRESYAAGANGYIQKPVSSREFERVLNQVLTYWLEVNRAPGFPVEPGALRV